MTVVIVDLDILADNRQREHLKPDNGSGDWETYHAAGSRDLIDHHGMFLVRGLSRAGASIYGLIDRPEKWREPTQGWIAGHALPVISFAMRPPGDIRPSPEVKAHMLAQSYAIEPSIVVLADDRLAEVARAAGLYVIQVSRS